MSTAAVAGIEKSERPQRNNLMMHCKALGGGRGEKSKFTSKKQPFILRQKLMKFLKVKIAKNQQKELVL